MKSNHYAPLVQFHDPAGGWIITPKSHHGHQTFRRALAVGRRDCESRERTPTPRAELIGSITRLLDEIQKGMFDRAKSFRDENTRTIDSKDEFYEFFKGDGGFARTHWSPEAEEQIKNDLNVTLRVIEGEEKGTCPFTGKPSSSRAVFGKSY